MSVLLSIKVLPQGNRQNYFLTLTNLECWFLYLPIKRVIPVAAEADGFPRLYGVGFFSVLLCVGIVVDTRHGTAAVDRTRFPYGTIFEVPGYGYARGEDAGGAIKGNHIDLWFPSHQAAKNWGKRRLRVRVWPAKS